MASLGEMYARALADDLGYERGWVPNWPPSFPMELGRVGELVCDHDTGIVSLEGNNKLADYGITAGPAKDGPDGRPPHVLVGISDKGRDRGPTLRPLVGSGSKSQVPALASRLSFGKDGGMQAEADGLRHHGLPDTDGLRKALREAGKNGSIQVGKSIVVELESAQKAMIVASESSSGSLQVASSVNVQSATVGLATFSLGFSIRRQTGKATVQAYPNRITTAFKALTVGYEGDLVVAPH